MGAGTASCPPLLGEGAGSTPAVSTLSCALCRVGHTPGRHGGPTFSIFLCHLGKNSTPWLLLFSSDVSSPWSTCHMRCPHSRSGSLSPSEPLGGVPWVKTVVRGQGLSCWAVFPTKCPRPWPLRCRVRGGAAWPVCHLVRSEAGVVTHTARLWTAGSKPRLVVWGHETGSQPARLRGVSCPPIHPLPTLPHAVCGLTPPRSWPLLLKLSDLK